ncbi:helix-turn-helix transcriptional regulator [Nocardia sp. NPDC051570]|uniref:helix-turn-helix transcriptional regulator n=1 Tax=Nocardia sp. NPDC051570 TaxID=3364324 RepID=UPI0037875F04
MEESDTLTPVPDSLEPSATTIELVREASFQLAKLTDILKKLEETAVHCEVDPTIHLSVRPGEYTAPRPRVEIDFPVAGLTKREQQVLGLLIEGLTNRLIARTLGIAEATVKNHLHSIFMKLKVTGRSQVIAMILSGPATGSPPPSEAP